MTTRGAARRVRWAAAVMVAGFAPSGCVPVAGTAGSPVPGRAEATARRPNILFILVDDMGFADPSVTGNRKVATPNIDRLAAEGLLMTQFTVAAPICSASRAGFMTGRFPARDRFVNFINDRAFNASTGQADWLDGRLPNAARLLRDAGYATGHFGKWHLGGGRDIGDAPLLTAYGFDESYTQFEGLGPRVLMSEDDYGLASKSAALGQGPIDRLPKGQITGRYVDRALAFIDRQGDRPWFVQLWPDDVHDPWWPTPTQLAAVKGRGRNADEDKFLATLVAMDAEIGRLVETLRSQGKLDETLVVLTGDNGPSAAPDYYREGAEAPGDAGPFRGRKGSLYEGGLREPLIVRWGAAIRPGARDATTVANGVDLLPTLAAVAGVAAPAGLDGISLLPAWRGRPIERRPDLLFAYGAFGPPARSPRPFRAADRSPGFAVRAAQWKLLAGQDGAGAQLYDLQADPGESRDLAAERPDVVRMLTPRLTRWVASLPLVPWARTHPAALRP